MDKPVVKLVGENGNIFNIMGIVIRELKRNGMTEEAKKYQEEVMACHSYDEALSVAFKYVDVE